jgi:hypothetical protein
LPVCPQFVAADAPVTMGPQAAPNPGAQGAPFLALPGDPAHAVPERRVSGPTRFVLRDGRFVSEDPPSGGAAKVV